MPKTIISINHVTKDFGAVRAVNDAHFEIAEGEFFSLLGPSGCGKTTLLRMLAGFEVPSGGSIHIDGQDVTLIAPNHRPVNMVFQSYAIFPHLNVASNIAFGMRKSGLSKRELAERIEEMLELIRLPGYGERGGKRAVRRPTATGRVGESAHQAAAGAAPGRTFGGARQEAERADADRAASVAAAGGHHLRVRDP